MKGNRSRFVKKFDFKLQKLLEIRQKKEDQEKIELAKASGAYQFEVNKKDKILNNIKDLRQELGRDKKALDLSRLQSYDKLTRNSEFAILQLDKVIEEKRKVMQVHIDKYASLKKDKRAVEIIKEKALKRFQEEQEHEEQKDTDEIGKNLFLNRKEKDINSENDTKGSVL